MVQWYSAKNGWYKLRGDGRKVVVDISDCPEPEQPVRATDDDLDINPIPVKVRGRKYLVGSTGKAGGSLMPSFIPRCTASFPRTFKFSNASTTTTDEAIEMLGKHIRNIIETQLTEVGALLFKQMPHVRDAKDFSKLMASIGYSPMDYAGGTSVRVKKAANVLTASSDPSVVSIEPHLEMAYNKNYPKKVFFFCASAPLPSEGGETPVVDMLNFNEALPSSMVKKLTETGIKYMRRLPSATARTDNDDDGKDSNYDNDNASSSNKIYTWQNIFSAETREEAEVRCHELGYEYQWGDDG